MEFFITNLAQKFSKKKFLFYAFSHFYFRRIVIYHLEGSTSKYDPKLIAQKYTQNLHML